MTDVLEKVTLATDSPTPTGGVGSVGNTNLPATTASPQFAGQTAAWEGILLVEGVVTGDGREFSVGSLTWPDPMATLMPISWQKAAIGGHDGSVVVARIDQVWRDPADPTIIRASGVFDLGSPDGAEAYRQVKECFMKGVSVDVDSVKDSDVEFVYPVDDTASEDGDAAAADEDSLMMLFGPPPEKQIFHAGRIRGATLVALPAFVEAQITLVDQQPALTASAGSVCRQLNKIAPHMRRDGEFDVALGARQIGITLSSVAIKMSYAQRQALHAHLAEHMRELSLTPQPFSLEAMSDEVRMQLGAKVTESQALSRPPGFFFDDPQLVVPTPLTVEKHESGYYRVYGHAGTFGTCHIGYPGACVTVPFETEHSYFLLGDVDTTDGSRAIGSITLGTGHASTDPSASLQATMAHYDNTGTAVADVACGNDAIGVWVNGYIRPGTPEAKITELKAAKISGDWRPLGGKLRLVAMLAVNVPGFPVPRTTIRMDHGKQLALLAAGIVQDVTAPSRTDLDAIRKMKLRLAKGLGRDPDSRRAELRARVHQTGE